MKTIRHAPKSDEVLATELRQNPAALAHRFRMSAARVFGASPVLSDFDPAAATVAHSSGFVGVYRIRRHPELPAVPGYGRNSQHPRGHVEWVDPTGL